MNECPNCNKKYKSIGIHWNYCGHPELSQHQKDMLIGGLMSDATVTDGGNIPQFTIYNTNKEFLQWYRDELEFLSNGVRLYEDGESKHQRNIKNSFDVERDANYKDVYCMTTAAHPYNHSLRDWYQSGEKEYPKNIELTKDILKIWYCGDGNVNWDTKSSGYCEIGCINEIDNEQKVLSLFDDTMFNPTFSNGRIRFNGQSKEFLDFISPVPNGMEYKWCIDNRNKYNKLI